MMEADFYHAYNHRGERVVLGITDKRPRKVVGCQAFAQPKRTRLATYSM